MDTIYLYTKDKEYLSHFFSHIFDMDLFVDEEGIRLSAGSFHIKIVEVSQAKRYQKEEICFEVRLAGNDQLSDIKNKIEFLSYRDHKKLSSVECDETRLKFHDPDGRLWVMRSDS